MQPDPAISVPSRLTAQAETSEADRPLDELVLSVYPLDAPPQARQGGVDGDDDAAVRRNGMGPRVVSRQGRHQHVPGGLLPPEGRQEWLNGLPGSVPYQPMPTTTRPSPFVPMAELNESRHGTAPGTSGPRKPRHRPSTLPPGRLLNLVTVDHRSSHRLAVAADVARPQAPAGGRQSGSGHPGNAPPSVKSPATMKPFCPTEVERIPRYG